MKREKAILSQECKKISMFALSKEDDHEWFRDSLWKLVIETSVWQSNVQVAYYFSKIQIYEPH